MILRTEWERILFPASDPEALAKMVRWARVLLFGHAALALIFVLSGNWILLFLVTFAPFFARWFGTLTHVPQHIGMEPDVADWRRSTRTYLAGPFVRFFYWNMNYHVEHHMFAAVPFLQSAQAAQGAGARSAGRSLRPVRHLARDRRYPAQTEARPHVPPPAGLPGRPQPNRYLTGTPAGSALRRYRTQPG